ncbi:MAG TPA: tRNA (adenosine(37)-N6)-dimethylallyltransferase MiaA [Spirochaetota bacterium]|nr:tRNA (adenosine(37)-N6)-dimethylallyltransferase MiaA [Spirochaetota bacterium]HPJ36101.1 tRNA (adenosine(37)-N6)-dimethylallyltransferase MiaA [Spirochaetota bacterium]
MNKNFNIITVTGPTACGKTRIAVRIALRYGGEIISGDSRQVYRGMDIGTGKDLDEYITESGPVPYHLIDIADPSEDYNLFRYVNDFDKTFDLITGRKKIPVLCGGSGLYIEAAVKGYDLPDIPENNGLREELEGIPKEKLLSILKEESPEIYSRTDISSSRRIIRGIEIARYMKNSNISAEPKRPARYTPLVIAVAFPREEVIRRIDSRLDKRLKEGMISEVETLIKQGVPVSRLIKLGLEYRYCAMYLNGEIAYDRMVEKLGTEIHRFAKRQMTWLRGMERRGLPFHWIKGDDIDAAFDIIDNAGFRPADS